MPASIHVSLAKQFIFYPFAKSKFESFKHSIQRDLSHDSREALIPSKRLPMNEMGVSNHFPKVLEILLTFGGGACIMIDRALDDGRRLYEGL